MDQHPVQGEQKYSKPLHATETGISSGSCEPVLAPRLHNFSVYLSMCLLFDHCQGDFCSDFCGDSKSPECVNQRRFYGDFVATSCRFCGNFTTFFQRLGRSACDVNTKLDRTMSPIVQQTAVACLGIGTVILCRRPKKRRERKIWVKPWISTNMY